MPNFKNIVKINRETEKIQYRIMNDLKLYGDSLIKETSPDLNISMIKFSHKIKPIVEQNLLEDPWSHRGNDNIVKKRLFRLPQNEDHKKVVTIKEIKGNDISLFHFKRRRLI